MDFYLQYGYGMMEHCRHLIQSWGSGAVILSPRDLEEDQLEKIGSDIIDRNGVTLLDPQLYNPRANHHRLIQHDYWPDEYTTGILSGGPALDKILQELKSLNTKSKTSKYILPSVICETVDDDWLHIQQNIINSSDNILNDKPTLATICLSSDSLKNEEQIESIINSAEKWNVSGYYIVPEHDNYLVEDPVWLANLLMLCSGLKLQNREVLVGYCSHQMLCLAAANVDAIASGIWLNVRAFNRNKFTESEDDSTSRRTKWYYCYQSLSEYKIPFLDMAYNTQILSSLQPENHLNTYAAMLFSGTQPSTTDYNEQSSFRHYLLCLRNQTLVSRLDSYRETINRQNAMLDAAERLIRELHRNGVRGNDRDFANIVDVNKAALQILDNNRGFVLERSWI